MGAWGTGPFDNDIAADWVLELDASDDPRATAVEAFTAALDADGLDDGSADMAYAAAAWLAGVDAGEDGTPTVPAPPLDPQLVNLATRSLQRMIAQDSAWLELWAGEEDGVVEAVTSILARLQPPLT